MVSSERSLDQLYENEDELPFSFLRTIPNFKSIQNLKNFSKIKEKWPENLESLFTKYHEHFDYSDFNLELLVYKNISNQFDLENRNFRFLHMVFPKPTPLPLNQIGRKEQNYLQFIKRFSLPYKILEIFKNVELLFEFTLLNNRNNIKPADTIELYDAVDENRQFWIIDEAVPNPGPKDVIPGEAPSGEQISNKSIMIDDSNLSHKIIEKCTH